MHRPANSVDLSHHLFVRLVNDEAVNPVVRPTKNTIMDSLGAELCQMCFRLTLDPVKLRLGGLSYLGRTGINDGDSMFTPYQLVVVINKIPSPDHSYTFQIVDRSPNSFPTFLVTEEWF